MTGSNFCASFKAWELQLSTMDAIYAKSLMSKEYKFVCKLALTQQRYMSFWEHWFNHWVRIDSLICRGKSHQVHTKTAFKCTFCLGLQTAGSGSSDDGQWPLRQFQAVGAPAPDGGRHLRRVLPPGWRWTRSRQGPCPHYEQVLPRPEGSPPGTKNVVLGDKI